MSMSMWVVLESRESTDHLFAGREEGFGNGQSIPRHLDQLDEAARALGIPPLSGFAIVLATVDDTVEPPWFRPEDGLACVRGLLHYLDGTESPDLGRLGRESLEGRILGPELTPDQHALLGGYALRAAAADLRTFEVELTFAAARRTRFNMPLSF